MEPIEEVIDKNMQNFRIDFRKLKRFKNINVDLYDILLHGVRAYLGENNCFSLEITIPGLQLHHTPTMAMLELLKDQKILINKK